MNMIGSIILLSVGLTAANPIGFELLKDHLFKKNKAQPVYVTGQQYYQQVQQPVAPDLTYGPPEVPGTNPQGQTTIVGAVPQWQWPQKHIFQKPVQVYQPVYHIPKPQYVPVVKPFPVYHKPEIVIHKPAKPTFEEIKSGFVNKIEGIKSDIASKISGIKSGVTDKIVGAVAIADVIKTDISDKVHGIKSGIYTGISDKVTGVKDAVDGIKGAVADGITDKIVGLKVIGAHIGDEVKEVGTAVGSALKVVKNDFYNKKHHQPQYVLVPARPTYTLVHPQPQPQPQPQPPTLTYGPPELPV